MSEYFTPILLSVPHLQQSRDGDCLPACAYMILSYIGKRIRYWRLRWLLGTQSFGTPFFHIRRIERLGITVEVKSRGTLALLHQHLLQNHPCLVSVQTENLPYWAHNTLHAVVVVGMDDKTVYLNDPEFPEAPIAVSLGDFDLAWLAEDERYAVLIP
jgi:ABC-type bacteriocin/lantibiotic exporter with double-glycine peptidase domain